MSEYGKGYILKSALLEAVQWDNDVEKWVIWDDDLQSLMTEKNDVVEVVRCKDCADFRPWGGQSKLGDCNFATVWFMSATARIRSLWKKLTFAAMENEDHETHRISILRQR